jgi:D-glycero-alpha-D-manno-heptose-7-phosphate kinase
MRLVRIPLRISLCGGGSDLPSHYEEHGGAVLSFTIDKYIYITAKPNTSLFPNNYRLVYSRIEECKDRNSIIHPIIRELVDFYGVGALDLDVMSDIPAGTGMGSSSAFTAGLHLALGGKKSKHELAELACQTEIDSLKEPIGKQDQYAAAFGGLNYFEFTRNRVIVNPINIPSNEQGKLLDCMHLVYVGGNRSASKLLKEQFNNDNSEALKQTADLAWFMKKDLEKGNHSDIGYMIQEGWELKKSLSPNVSNDTVDAIIDIALNNGAGGGKLLGAGGAGFVLLFCDPNDQHKMLSGLKPLNLTYVPFGMDFEGAKILYED